MSKEWEVVASNALENWQPTYKNKNETVKNNLFKMRLSNERMSYNKPKKVFIKRAPKDDDEN